MHRQIARDRLPLTEQSKTVVPMRLGCFAKRRQAPLPNLPIRQTLARRLMAVRPRAQLQQLRVGFGEHRIAQHLHQRPIIIRAHQPLHQRH